MQIGELIVVGKDQAVIHLLKLPHKVHVRFKHEQQIVPCAPHDYDSLEFEILCNYEGHRHPFNLVIKWNTSAPREIVWSVQ
jgi:hypothetical protein